MMRKRWFMPVLAVLLAACSTPPDHFHTLRPAVRSAHEPLVAHEVSWVLAIGPVTVPDSLARDEWLIRTGDTGALVYDHQLWTQALSAEVAQSLADYLNCAPAPPGLGPDRCPLPDTMWADAGPTGSGNGTDLERPAPLRVRVQVLRFDTILAPSPAVSDQVRWTIECLPSDAALGPVDAGRYRIVRTAARESAGPAPSAQSGIEESQQRFDRVARAHSETVRRVAMDVAVALQESSAERAKTCRGGP